MDGGWILVLSVGTVLDVAILGIVFKVLVDMGALRERMARLEGLFQGFTGRKPEATQTLATDRPAPPADGIA